MWARTITKTEISNLEQIEVDLPNEPPSPPPMTEKPQIRGYAAPVVVLSTRNSNVTYELNLQELEGILKNKNIVNEKVVLISISGAFRKGKSFMLNLFVNYLEWLTGGENEEKPWLHMDTPMNNFHYRGGSQPHTNGITMWSKPYILKGGKGEEYAVLLMDTQGTFDHNSTVKDCASIFAMSTLLSSVQIFNLDKQIQGDDLNNLRLFTEYAQLVKTTDSTPFQKLLFLIRDWPNSDEHEFGFEGGNNYLLSVLQIINGQQEENRTVRENLRKSFEKIEAFLMPNPGKHVANNNSKTILGKIDEEFEAELLNFIPSFFETQNIVNKRVNGHQTTCGELCELFKTYMNIFNSDQLPEPKSIIDATAEAVNTSAEQAAKEEYDDVMKTFMEKSEGLADLEKLEAFQIQAESAAKERFEARPKLGENNEQKNVENLAKYFKSRYSDFKKVVEQNIRLAEEKRRAEEEHQRLLAEQEKERQRREELERAVAEQKEQQIQFEKEHKEQMKKQKEEMERKAKELEDEIAKQQAAQKEQKKENKEQLERIRELRSSLETNRKEQEEKMKQQEENFKKEKERMATMLEKKLQEQAEEMEKQKKDKEENEKKMKKLEENIGRQKEELKENEKKQEEVLKKQKEEMEKKLMEQQAQQREQQRKEKEEQEKKIKDLQDTMKKQQEEALKTQREALEKRLKRERDEQEERIKKEKEQQERAMDELKKELQMEKEAREKREREEQEKREKEQRERERRAKEEQRRNPKIIGMFCQNPREYEVISNIEVHNRSRFMMELFSVTMHRGVAEIPPTNVGPNEILRCGFHKTNFSYWGCGGEICWRYIVDGTTYYVTLYFDTIWKSLIYQNGNGVGLELWTGNKLIEQVKAEGSKTVKLRNDLISVTASTGDTNHTTIRMSIDDA